MPDAALSSSPPRAGLQHRHISALIGANVALAVGPWSVRLADCGTIAAEFWLLLML